MNNELFQEIFDKLQDGLPEEWDKVVLYVAYFDGNFTMKYYAKKDETGYVDCYNIEGMNNSKLVKLFMSLNNIIAPDREKLGKKKWSVMTMIVSADGEFKTEFDYDNIDDISLDYEDDWEKKYLE